METGKDDLAWVFETVLLEGPFITHLFPVSVSWTASQIYYLLLAHRRLQVGLASQRQAF